MFIVFITVLFSLATSCFPPEKIYRAEAWPAANQLFQQEAGWVGADDAYSVALDGNRTLWLFADSFIDTTRRHNRQRARLIRNSIAVQTGNNPASAKIAFFWGKNNFNHPTSFFPERGNEWFWPGHGIRLQNRLIIFLMRVRGTKTGLGFEVYDWEAVQIPNPDDSPANWTLQWLNVPKNSYQVIVGSASTLQFEKYIYAFGSRESVPDHPIFLTRWPIKKFAGGDLSGIEWWESSRRAWVPQADLKNIPTPIFTNGQTELTVHFDRKMKRFMCIQTVGFGAADVCYRTAQNITGPWSEPFRLYEPPEKQRQNILIYAAKAHPQLFGADLVLTYATNSAEFPELLADTSIYYPRFIRVKFENLE